ncbi:hypothetical protein [Clostridium sp. Cult3]|uniref:hypothetical protein n=1 Tax=Clostridium sp. Cult3 TaxID=2079004 RepID=UPI001F3470CD|nr:hypothetical protein [Clostridium sp. Cult3]MCF6461484.1 hypothetical protein [Clostridium sp. Cult3]
MYAIRDKRTKKWLCGTDYSEYPYRQRISHNRALTFEDKEDAEWEFKRRECSKDFEVVEVELNVMGGNNYE